MRKNSNLFPFNPGKWPFFYGWFIIIAATVGIIGSVPGQTFGISAFTEHLIEALSINRTMLSLAYLIGTIGGAFLLTWGGKVYDLIGARRTALIAAGGLGIILLYLSQVDNISSYLAGLVGQEARPAAAFIAITFGFLVLRFSGQGMLTMTSRNMLMKWFDHKRGFANGIMGAFVALAFSGTPYFFDRMITSFGWRTSWFLMGVIVLCGLLLFIAVFFRDNPEACGLQPDGGAPPKPGDPQHDPAQDYTLKEARKTLRFWVFNLTIALHAFFFTSFTFHVVSLFEQAGIDKTRAFAIFMPASLIAVTARVFCGWISDHIPLKHLLFVLIGGMAISMSGFLLLSFGAGYYMIILGNGISGGVFGLLATVTWPRYFGRTHLGAISGFHMSWVVAFSAVGPFLFGLSFSQLGSYITAILASLIFLGGLFAAALNLKPGFHNA